MSADLPSGTAGAALDPRARNAVKHGLTAKHVLDMEVEAFQAALSGLTEQFQPVGPHETALCARIARLTVRLERAGKLEGTMFADCYGDDGFDQLRFERTVATVGRYEQTIARALAKTSHELERVIAKREGDPVSVPSIVDFNW